MTPSRESSNPSQVASDTQAPTSANLSASQSAWAQFSRALNHLKPLTHLFCRPGTILKAIEAFGEETGVPVDLIRQHHNLLGTAIGTLRSSGVHNTGALLTKAARRLVDSGKAPEGLYKQMLLIRTICEAFVPHFPVLIESSPIRQPNPKATRYQDSYFEDQGIKSTDAMLRRAPGSYGSNH